MKQMLDRGLQAAEARARLLLSLPSAPDRCNAPCILSGSLPDATCGVDQYSIRLARSLGEAGLAHSLLRLPDWSAFGTMRARHALRKLRPALLHLQYPTLAYGRSLGPHVLAPLSAAPLVVTLHEYSAFSPPRRRSLALFAQTARHIVFTTEGERQLFLAQHPECRERSSVIPIGSNMPVSAATPAREVRITFFGQVRPQRGVDALIEAARTAQHYGHRWRFVIIGASLPEFQQYLHGLRASAASLPIEWKLDLCEDEVARELASATIVYLPYPDGVSERRGTLLAALANGAAVVTVDGRFRPSGIEAAVRFASNPHSAVRLMAMLIGDGEARDALRVAARQYAERYGWDHIAALHIDLYRRLGVPCAAGRHLQEAAE